MIGLRKLFVRTDLPGVGQGDYTASIDESKKSVTIRTLPPPPGINIAFPPPHIQNHYSSQVRLLRDREYHPSTAEFTGPILLVHPDLLTEGLRMAYAYKQLQDGSAHVSLDMPGVPKGDFTAEIENGRVIVTGRAPAVSHDSNGRFYSAVAATISNPTGTNPLLTVEGGPENGVLRLNIRPG
ncbi:hypothetical protein Bca101_078770 [Brassica carinata]